jgi:para-aminobenzoate synthetase component 1
MDITAKDASFWMGGRLASELSEISHDPVSLERDGFWAVQIDYEGKWTLAKFDSVVEAEFPQTQWNAISDPWSSSHSREQYIDYVSQIREAIADGVVYQANACRVLSAPCTQSLSGLFSKILSKNPAPYATYFRAAGLEIASASPELFLKITSAADGVYVKSSPIKGTSKSPEFGEKDESENVMIVDLIRNDLSRICEDGSVDVSRLLGVEKHPGLFHLVSDVVGKLRRDFSWNEFSKALLPAGSISGAPKFSALKIIAAHEKSRGPYCGVIGWIERKNGDVTGVLSVGIRLFWLDNNQIHFGTGAGITWGSDAVAEWDETELKANRLIAIARGEDVK